VVIAIDGPAGAGKSSVARELARELGFTYLDSGAMYRGVGLLSLAAPGRDPGELARAASVEFAPDAEGTAGRVLLNGREVTREIRTPEVSAAASRVAAHPDVRAAVVEKQRALLAHGDWVAEGRDIGTVVAPQAELKIYLDASPAERARRRASELGVDAATVLAEQAERDARDEGRAHSPLRAAPDAVLLDTSALPRHAVVQWIAELAREARGREASL